MTQLPYDPDLMTIVAVAFHEVDTIEIGSGVVPIQVQHPTQLAQRALTLNLISGGRFTLGIGMSHRMVTEQMWGISYDKPLRRMREYLDGLLPLLGRAGRRRGRGARVAHARRRCMIPGAPTPDVYVAALGPQLLRLAGRRTAGTLYVDDGTLDARPGTSPRDAASGRRGGGARGRGDRRCGSLPRCP